MVKNSSIKNISEKAKSENLPRTHQLLNKTNQMNLSTRRLSEKELNIGKINRLINYGLSEQKTNLVTME